MKEFKAESKKLLDMMINSIYTHKEIFLRELVSNASDAIDRLYYKALTENLSGLTREDFSIDIRIDKEMGTITISDNGCGMTEEDLDNNLGTIAHSGALDFKSAHDKVEDIDVIGQFGVGFYSAFMVSERVTVLTKAYGEDKAYLWTSTGVDGYTVEESVKDSSGTVITLYLKDEEKGEFLEEYRLRSIIKQYSDYIRYPITLNVEKTRKVEDKEETYTEIETVNSMVPVWKKKKSEVAEEEYDSFYREKFHDYEKPLHVVSVSAEGAVTYNALLFIPSRPPYDYYTKDYEKGLQLYCNGVVIMDKCKELLPDCFSFVKGLVDSSDLTLNISRETLQHNRQLTQIATNLEKKIKSELLKLLKDKREDYEKFYGAFGLQLKVGMYADFGMKKDLLKDLVMFHSDKEDKLITFGEYVSAMPEDEKYIYYATGASVGAIKSLPQLEMARSKGLDILYLTHEVDEFAIRMLGEYEGKQFKSVSSFEVTDGDDTSAEDTSIFDAMREALGDKVKKVVASKRLVNAAVCLTSEGEISIEMEKTMRSMPGNDGKIKAEKVLEINAGHSVYSKLKDYHASDREKFNKLSEVLYTQACLIEGLGIENPAEYTEMLMQLL